MTELDQAIARRKVGTIQRDLADLAAAATLSLDAYRSDRLRQKGVERLLQEIVDAAADVNVHLLRLAGAPAPGDYRSSFLDAGRHGIIPEPLAIALAPAAGLRNRLVHEYDEIDDAVVLGAVADACRLFAEYVAAVERYLTARSSNSP